MVTSHCGRLLSICWCVLIRAMTTRSKRHATGTAMNQGALSIPDTLPTAGTLELDSVKRFKREHEAGPFARVRASRGQGSIPVDELRAEWAKVLLPQRGAASVEGVSREERSLTGSAVPDRPPMYLAACGEGEQALAAQKLLADALHETIRKRDWQELWVLLGQVGEWLQLMPTQTSGGVLPWWVQMARSAAGSSGVAEIVQLSTPVDVDVEADDARLRSLERREAALVEKEAALKKREAELEKAAPNLQLQPTAWEEGCFGLCAEDLKNRNEEDHLRQLFRSNRAAPEIQQLHAGLVGLFDHSLKCRAPDPGYALMLDTLTRRYGLSFEGESPICDSEDEFMRRLHQYFGGQSPRGQSSAGQSSSSVIDKLLAIHQTENCGWIIAGGAVLRAVLDLDESPGQRGAKLGSQGRDGLRAVPSRPDLFQGNDIDVFIWARGELHEQQQRANNLAERICNGLGGKLSRSRWTIDIEVPGESRFDVKQHVQIILRVYHSPSEVLCGFDVDPCCVGFDGKKVWALPRAIRGLETGCTILNPLHAWPNQPSYELRLAKYAARGFVLAVPGIKLEEINWEQAPSSKLIDQVGLARLVHVHVALSLPRVSQAPMIPFAHVDRLHDRLDWESSMRRSLGYRVEIHDSRQYVANRVTVLPVEEDFAKMIIKDPYEWIHACMGGSKRRTWRSDPEPLPELNIVNGRIILNADWATILDAGDDSTLKIPRYLTWSLEPRSREYMNMQVPPAELCRSYYLPALRRHGEVEPPFTAEAVDGPFGFGATESGAESDDSEPEPHWRYHRITNLRQKKADGEDR